MKGFQREDLSFSLCGLNCALCPMKLDGHCPGCGGGTGNQSCKIARCSLEHGGAAYCFQCGEYPCGMCGGIDRFDSFITHQRQLADMEKAREMGPERYGAELEEKERILRFLLENFNDGRRKTLFCVGVNLLELEALWEISAQLANLEVDSLPLKEKGAYAARLFQEAAGRQGLDLKLRRKK
ncbi:MAG: DUF3795 domain-containing protein [Oscillospiraceae bacterium]|nr:DUF3795 domain-containing protein [Oscillospiraceae bacterium]